MSSPRDHVSWLRHEQRDVLGQAAVWLVSATLGWIAIMAIDALWGGMVPSTRAVLYTSPLALLYTLVVSVPVALLHLLRRQWAKRSERLARWGVALLVVLLAAMPAWERAFFLVSGEKISQHAQVVAIRWAIFFSLLVFWEVVWQWHQRGVTWERAGRWHKSLWSFSGLCLVVALVYALRFRLTTYQHFATFLLPALWLVAASLSLALLRMCPPRLVAGVALVLCLVIGVGLLGPQDRREARSMIHAHQRIAALTENSVRAARPSPIRFELAGFRPEDCDAAQATRPPRLLGDASKRRNVLLISVDALRLDALDWQHRGTPLMPALQRFRSQALRFPRATTSYPATILAVGAAMTGLEPHRLAGFEGAPSSIFRLARHRFDSQFAILGGGDWFRQPVVERLILQGTETEFVSKAQSQTDRLIERLRTNRAKGQRTMAWAHYLAPHQPYQEHEGFEFGDSQREKYRSEVAHVDEQLGRLFAYLQGDGWFEDSLVIVFADHGESLGEKGYYGHHVYLNSWITDVPLLVRAPTTAARQSDAPVSLVSIAATVAHFLDLPPPAGGEHPSLFAEEQRPYAISQAFPIQSENYFKMADGTTLNPEQLQERLDVLQQGSDTYEIKVAITTSEYRLILNRDTDLLSLFDRRMDPKERRNVLFSDEQAATKLTTTLQQWHRQQSALLFCGATRPSR